jgi:hypothetical protein
MSANNAAILTEQKTGPGKNDMLPPVKLGRKS